MIPAGYMYKRVAPRPEWLKASQVEDVFSVSGCISKDAFDWIDQWLHNGHWLFDSPEILKEAARLAEADLAGSTLFYYEVHPQQFDEQARAWSDIAPEPSFTTNVVPPARKTLQGYDVATFSVGTSVECSPLSCNNLAGDLATNARCLFESFAAARTALEAGRFDHSEPGPMRIFAVYMVEA
jgi:hypothetical protein